jgi:hypothetical protein
MRLHSRTFRLYAGKACLQVTATSSNRRTLQATGRWLAAKDWAFLSLDRPPTVTSLQIQIDGLTLHIFASSYYYHATTSRQSIQSIVNHARKNNNNNNNTLQIGKEEPPSRSTTTEAPFVWGEPDNKY